MWIQPLRRELTGHLSYLDKYLGSQALDQEPSISQKIKKWKYEGWKFLIAQDAAKILPDINRQIMFSLQKFMVRKSSVVCSIHGSVPRVLHRSEARFELR
jgi:hypothetical protein